MTEIITKRVYEPTEKSDGFRVLVDKLYPRGIKKENLHCDLWAKELAPSTALREWYHQDEAHGWEEFRTRYLLELRNSEAAKAFEAEISDKKTVTLLYASKNIEQNNALVLQEYLKKSLTIR